MLFGLGEIAAMLGIFAWLVIQIARSLGFKGLAMAAVPSILFVAVVRFLPCRGFFDRAALFSIVSFLRLLNWHLDTFWTWLQLKIFLPRAEHTAHDQLPVMQGVKTLRVPYGEEWFERVNVVYPKTKLDAADWLADIAISFRQVTLKESDTIPEDCIATDHIPVLYVHGGGFVAANPCVLMQSVTPFVRAGLTVFAIEYPKAPNHRFPAPVLSTLKAMKWMKQTFKQDAIQVCGDSAGASIAGVAIAIASNPNFREEFEIAAQRAGCLSGPLPSDLPRCERFASIYGIMEPPRDAFPIVGYNVQRMDTITWLEQQVANIGIHFCFTCHCSKHPEISRCTLCEYLPDLEVFPPTLMQCGDKDFLHFGNRNTVSKMHERGLQVHYSEYKARHAFAGFPPVWTASAELRAQAALATAEQIEFLTGRHSSILKRAHGSFSSVAGTGID